MKAIDTPEDLAPYEPAARLYCEMRGVDPDGVMVVNHPMIAGATMALKHWTHAAERMLDMSCMMVAIKRAEAAKKEPAIMVPS